MIPKFYNISSRSKTQRLSLWFFWFVCFYFCFLSIFKRHLFFLSLLYLGFFFHTSCSWQDLICRMAASVKEQSTKPIPLPESPPCEWVCLCFGVGPTLWLWSEKERIILNILLQWCLGISWSWKIVFFLLQRRQWWRRTSKIKRGTSWHFSPWSAESR